MSSAQVGALLHSLSESWPTWEAVLLAPLESASFCRFVADFRGLSGPDAIRRSPGFAARRAGFVGGILGCARNLFALEHFASADEARHIALLVEESVNLGFYCWHGKGDRNYQLRTLVRYFEADGESAEVYSDGAITLHAIVTEDGLCFRDHIGPCLARCAPVAAALGLLDLLPVAGGEIDAQIQRLVLSRARTVQREVCLLVDEWEHRNTLLAVRFNRVREKLETDPSPQNEQAFLELTELMTTVRDHLAIWCTRSFALIEDWLAIWLLQEGIGSDVRLELDAVEAVTLAAMQKIFLPASVSRHRYDRAIPALTQSWCEARLRIHPDDLSARLLFVSAKASLGDVDSAELKDLLSFLDKKAHEWVLTFDPSTGLKAFSWSYNEEFHTLLSLLVAVAFARKFYPRSLDEMSLITLATLLQMSETFPPSDKPVAVVPFADSQLLQRLGNEVLTVLGGDNLPTSDSAVECLEYVEKAVRKYCFGGESDNASV